MYKSAIILLLTIALASGCSEAPGESPPQTTPPAGESAPPAQPQTPPADTENPDEMGDDAGPDDSSTGGGGEQAGNDPSPEAAPVDTDPQSITVMVNKQYALPDNYSPDDLVYPEVRFIFSEKIEKRMLRKEAAEALERLFEGAEKDGIYLSGVSGYRSHATQTSLFQRYVDRDGEEKAKTYSAVPGHSEHETGLAIDVTSSDGKCAAQDCFGGTPEALWLADHAHEYGFIIRYPEDKDAITGYQYEPWHLRYVGKDLAGEIMEKGLTLEEYYGVVPVSN